MFNCYFCRMNFTHWWQLLFYVFCLITLIQLFYYGYFFIRLAFYKARPKASSQTHPVSVIICARDEAANLAKNLPGALVQQYSTTHEVIVVDDNSYDDTKYLLEEFQKSLNSCTWCCCSRKRNSFPVKNFR